MEDIQTADPRIYEAMRNELRRQRDYLEMIPSENFTSPNVLKALGSVLTNKYSEGYSGRRYYGGNQFVDVVEGLAVDRAKRLFGVPYANVQPYSGSPANFEIYAALCKPGDTVMGLTLTDGGHLTHGDKVSFSGIFFNSVQYHVKPDGFIDIDEVRRLAQEKRPKLIWIGTTAYVRELPFEEFAKIADEVGAYLAADISHVTGLIIAGAHKSPVQYAHIIMSTTHKTLRGPRGAIILVTDKGLKKDPEMGERIDKAVFPGGQGGPHDNNTAAIAIALDEASKPEFKEYGMQVAKNAKALADRLMKRGVKLVTNGTDNHMMLIDLTPVGNGLGLFGQEALDIAGIVVNKNTIPHEPASPFYPSGIRLGTPAITTRGMKEPEMEAIGDVIADALDEIKPYSMEMKDKDTRKESIARFRNGIKDNKRLMELRKTTLDLCNRFPLYEGLEF